MRFAFGIGFLLIAGFVKAQAPLCLIGQPPATNNSPIFDLVNPLANELTSGGQLKPATYTVLDPVVRDAFLNGKIAKPNEFYKLNEVQQAAKALGAPYVMWIEGQYLDAKVANTNQKAIMCRLTLYKNGKQIWQGADNQAVMLSNSQSQDDTLKAIMSSLNTKMQLAPLKDMPTLGKEQPNNPIGKGQAPVIPERADDDPILNDWAAIQNRIKELISNNRMGAAELLLRDAIDADPLSAERRQALIEFLRDRGKVDEAVATTIHAAQVLNDPKIASIAAKILLDAGRVAEANEILKTAIAATPGDANILYLTAEHRLRTSVPEQALKHIENGLKIAPTIEGTWLRAICRGLLGSEEGVKLDLEKINKDDPAFFIENYQRLGNILDGAWTVEGPDLRALLQKTVLKRDAEEVSDTIDAQERMAKACIALLGEEPPAARYEKSHGLRLLALNLLLQTMSELRSYVATGSKEALDDATLDLGETLKSFTEAKNEFAKEVTSAGSASNNRFVR